MTEERDAAMQDLAVQAVPQGVTFEVRVAPRAARERVLGVHAGALKVSLTAPPVDGAANRALAALLAKVLGVSKGAVRVVRGQRSKTKLVTVAGIGAGDVRARLSGESSTHGRTA